MEQPLEYNFRRPELEVFSVQENNDDGTAALVIRDHFPANYATCFRYRIAAFDDDKFWRSIYFRLHTLLCNRVKFPETVFETQAQLLDFINTHHPRLSPQEKLDAVLQYIHQLTTFDGQQVTLDLFRLIDEEVPRKLFLSDASELAFYLKVLREDGYIDHNETETSFLTAHITLKGLNKLITLEEKKNSRVCFVAMSFSGELESVYTTAIAPAIAANGFIPLLLRNEQVDADKTINDAILAGLKKAKFTVADFTGHRANVYFEAGFALGRGQKVIYSCRADQVEQAHFDTRNFQHLVWTDEEDFRQKLSDKIQAYIID